MDLWTAAMIGGLPMRPVVSTDHGVSATSLLGTSCTGCSDGLTAASGGRSTGPARQCSYPDFSFERLDSDSKRFRNSRSRNHDLFGRSTVVEDASDGLQDPIA